jgi:hypothetical protein
MRKLRLLFNYVVLFRGRIKRLEMCWLCLLPLGSITHEWLGGRICPCRGCSTSKSAHVSEIEKLKFRKL